MGNFNDKYQCKIANECLDSLKYIENVENGYLIHSDLFSNIEEAEEYADNCFNRLNSRWKEKVIKHSYDFLCHHGALGMKWGIWNEETRQRYTGYKADNINIKYANKIRKLENKTNKAFEKANKNPTQTNIENAILKSDKVFKLNNKRDKKLEKYKEDYQAGIGKANKEIVDQEKAQLSNILGNSDMSKINYSHSEIIENRDGNNTLSSEYIDDGRKINDHINMSYTTVSNIDKNGSVNLATIAYGVSPNKAMQNSQKSAIVASTKDKKINPNNLYHIETKYDDYTDKVVNGKQTYGSYITSKYRDASDDGRVYTVDTNARGSSNQRTHTVSASKTNKEQKEHNAKVAEETKRKATAIKNARAVQIDTTIRLHNRRI